MSFDILFAKKSIDDIQTYNDILRSYRTDKKSKNDKIDAIDSQIKFMNLMSNAGAQMGGYYKSLPVVDKIFLNKFSKREIDSLFKEMFVPKLKSKKSFLGDLEHIFGTLKYYEFISVKRPVDDSESESESDGDSDSETSGSADSDVNIVADGGANGGMADDLDNEENFVNVKSVNPKSKNTEILKERRKSSRKFKKPDRYNPEKQLTKDNKKQNDSNKNAFTQLMEILDVDIKKPGFALMPRNFKDNDGDTVSKMHDKEFGYWFEQNDEYESQLSPYVLPNGEERFVRYIDPAKYPNAWKQGQGKHPTSNKHKRGSARKKRIRNKK